MAWAERLRPVRMERVAVVAPVEMLPEVLARVAEAGTVELDGAATPAAAVREVGEAAIVREDVAALAGWAPADTLPGLADRLGEMGGTLVLLPRPRGVDTPTLLRSAGVRRSLTPLVETYGTVPYADVDPTLLVAVTYVLMFGMMFGDAGHGAMLLLAAAALWAGRPRWLARWRRAAPLVLGAGLTSALFGLLYGECFGPSGLVPVLWLSPLDHPVPLLVAALGVGAVLLAGAYALGTVNRWREGGLPVVLYAPSGVAGSALFLGLGLVAGGLGLHRGWLLAAGAVVAAAGLTLAFTGFFVEAGGGAAGVAQASVELFDVVIRLGSNLVSFARLAAFGLTHAALWRGRVGRHRRAVAPGRGDRMGGGAGVRGRQRAGVRPGGAGRRRAGAAPGVLRAVLTGVPGPGRPFRPWHVPISSEGDLP